jgi:NitT/TauT family transport system substrate-binding protein
MAFRMALTAALLIAILAAPAAPAAAQPATPVRVGIIPVLGAAQLYVVDREKLAKGLEFKFTTFEAGSYMIQALASGSLDVYVAGVAPLGVARSKGIDMRVVVATAINEMTFAAGGRLAPYFKEGVAPADAFRAFRVATGKPARLATQPPGSTGQTTLAHWLGEVTKTDKGHVEIISMGIDATQQALLAGAVDGAMIREPSDTIVATRDPRIKVVALGGEMFRDQPGTVVAVSGAFLTKNPQAVQTLVDALVAATELIKREPRRVAPAIVEGLGKGIVDADTIVRALGSPASTFIADPRRIAEATARLQSFQVKIGTLEKDAPLDGLFDPSFYVKATGGM